jgi:arsenate reductase
MAEELLRAKLGDRVAVQSAGLEPGNLNPIVVDVLKETGIEISGKATQSVFDIYKKGIRFHYVITVCDETSGERCPIFPGAVKRLHWSFPDPSTFEGSYPEKLEQTRIVMKMIDKALDKFVAELDIS